MLLTMPVSCVTTGDQASIRLPTVAIAPWAASASSPTRSAFMGRPAWAARIPSVASSTTGAKYSVAILVRASICLRGSSPPAANASFIASVTRVATSVSRSSASRISLVLATAARLASCSVLASVARLLSAFRPVSIRSHRVVVSSLVSSVTATASRAAPRMFITGSVKEPEICSSIRRARSALDAT